MSTIKPQGYSSGGAASLERTLDYDFHKSIEELEEERKDLVIKVQEIDTQLSEKNITDVAGRRLGNKRYNEKRHELIKGKLKFNKRITTINKTIKRRRREDLEETIIRKEGRKESREQKREEIISKYNTKQKALEYIENRLTEIIQETMELQKITRMFMDK